MSPSRRHASRSESYEAFLRRHFPSVYRWCMERTGDVDQCATTAQRIVLDLYRLESRRRRPVAS
jgi:DNA-directed RNA polymerase specialized sigma24 family protein